MSLLNSTAIGSLVAQLVTGAIELSALFFDVKPEDTIVKDVLAMELSVQIVEFIFYLFLVYKIMTKTLEKDITGHRYIDWVITTPFMLLVLSLVLSFNSNTKIKLQWYAFIVFFNYLMLYFGYLGETGKLKKMVSSIFVLIAFLITFVTIFIK